MTRRFGLALSTCLLTSMGAQAGGIENALGMAFVELPAGSFRMGTDDLDAARSEFPDSGRADIGDEAPAHRVTLTEPVLMGRTEVTQGQWLEVMQNRPGPASHWSRDDWARLPVVGVSWHMAQRFTEELGRLDDALDYRLPTEAEWEYAARAGSVGLRPPAAEVLGSHAWFIDNSGDLPQPVSTRSANAFGLYDMLGNAWEWVADRYARDTYRVRAAGGAVTDPEGSAEGVLRVRRGGSYHCPRRLVRPGYRTADAPHRRYSVLGFRVVAVPRENGK